MSEINDNEYWPEGISPINFKIFDISQRKDPRLMDKYKNEMYKTNYFCEESKINLSLITCEDKIVILSIVKS